MKERPNSEDVIHWVAHSNIRDLALAIRDHARADALPQRWANALQEAGCNDEDLLDSCRRGDPDIDGVWVLKVLLGKSEASGNTPHPPLAGGESRKIPVGTGRGRKPNASSDGFNEKDQPAHPPRPRSYGERSPGPATRGPGG